MDESLDIYAHSRPIEQMSKAKVRAVSARMALSDAVMRLLQQPKSFAACRNAQPIVWRCSKIEMAGLFVPIVAFMQAVLCVVLQSLNYWCHILIKLIARCSRPCHFWSRFNCAFDCIHWDRCCLITGVFTHGLTFVKVKSTGLGIGHIAEPRLVVYHKVKVREEFDQSCLPFGECWLSVCGLQPCYL